MDLEKDQFQRFHLLTHIGCCRCPQVAILDRTLSGTNILQVKEGYRMPLPECTPASMHRLIEVKCWSDNPNERCTMAEVAKNLQRIMGRPRPNFAAVS